MDSSRSTTIGIALIMGIFLVWFFMNQPAKVTPPAGAPDSTQAVNPAQAPIPPQTASKADSSASAVTSSVFPVRTDSGVAATSSTIETPLFTATVSSAGGSVTSFVLKNYPTWNKKPLDLISGKGTGGDVNLKFVASDGKLVNTADLPFALESQKITLGEGDSAVITMRYQLDQERAIEKLILFSADNYLLRVTYRLHNLDQQIAGYNYIFAIDDPLPYAEERSADESNSAHGFAGINGAVEDVDVSKIGETVKKPLNGNFDFVGSRSRYFVKSLISKDIKATGAEIIGTASKAHDDGHIEAYTASLSIPVVRQPVSSVTLDYYMGPLEYSKVSSIGVGLEAVMNFGWSFLVRPISVHLLRPLFMWLHSFISNWGLVIIVFSMLIKLITIPLSTGQMKSMRKMQVLAPKITEMREKYKDDPKRQNEEMLKLYRTYGVNPAGGCLPMLLQMPILFALYSVLTNVIELRQADFFWFINDLSAPDALIKFGTHIPLLGDQLSGLTILLGATMFIQQVFSITDPRQKMLAYIMPIMFTFMFNGLPAGVALYYFMFNIFGLLQQFYMTKIAPPMDLEKMKVDPKKAKGGLLAKLQDLEKSAQEQRRQQAQGKKK